MSRPNTILEFVQALRGESFDMPDPLQLPEVVISRGVAVAMLTNNPRKRLLIDMNKTVVATPQNLFTFLQMPQQESPWIFAEDGIAIVGRIPPAVSVVPSYTTVALEEKLPDTLADEFCSLVAQWERETFMDSSLTVIFTHPAYQKIIGMGKDALTLILRELEVNSGQWFYALVNIVRADVAKEAGATTFAEARDAWLEWGRKQGYLR